MIVYIIFIKYVVLYIIFILKNKNYTFVFLFYILYYLHQGTDDHFYTQQVVLNVLRSLYV